MANRTVSFIVMKNFLLLLCLFSLAGSLYAGYASWRTLNRVELSLVDNPYGRQILGIWRFITVVTIALQDSAVLVGIIGAYIENYELTITCSLLSLTVFIMNLVNKSLLPTIVGPVFLICVAIAAFVFSRFLKNIEYQINDQRIKNKV